MGSILIRKLPDPLHRDFKKLCQDRDTSMEREIIRLILREVTKASAKASRKQAATVPPVETTTER